jgi:hypothetical protein
MARIYQLWTHRRRNQVYVVRLTVHVIGQRAYQIEGVCGPFDPLDLDRDTDWEKLDYEVGPALVGLQERQEEFTVHVLPPPRRRPRKR